MCTGRMVSYEQQHWYCWFVESYCSNSYNKITVMKSSIYSTCAAVGKILWWEFGFLMVNTFIQKWGPAFFKLDQNNLIFRLQQTRLCSFTWSHTSLLWSNAHTDTYQQSIEKAPTQMRMTPWTGATLSLKLCLVQLGMVITGPWCGLYIMYYWK